MRRLPSLLPSSLRGATGDVATHDPNLAAHRIGCERRHRHPMDCFAKLAMTSGRRLTTPPRRPGPDPGPRFSSSAGRVEAGPRLGGRGDGVKMEKPTGGQPISHPLPSSLRGAARRRGNPWPEPRLHHSRCDGRHPHSMDCFATLAMTNGERPNHPHTPYGPARLLPVSVGHCSGSAKKRTSFRCSRKSSIAPPSSIPSISSDGL